MTTDIDSHILHRYEIKKRLGKGVSSVTLLVYKLSRFRDFFGVRESLYSRNRLLSATRESLYPQNLTFEVTREILIKKYKK